MINLCDIRLHEMYSWRNLFTQWTLCILFDLSLEDFFVVLKSKNCSQFEEEEDSEDL